MSKNINVNPGNYKVAGRERQGEDIVHEAEKQTYAGRARRTVMPEKETIERAEQAKREGKAPTTQAGEFVREEMHHVREGKHGVRSPEQAIAIGLSKARRAGVDLPPPDPGRTSEETREKAKRDLVKARSSKAKRPSRARSGGVLKALKRESRATVSKKALAEHGKRAASRRSARDRSEQAKRAARTRRKGAAARH